MISPTETAPTFLSFSIFFLLFSGLIVFAWGKKLPGRGVWLVWAALLLLLTGVALDSGALLNVPFKIKIWMAGWIWPRQDQSAITVGILHDPLSFAMSVLSSVVAGALLLNRSFLGREHQPEKIYAGVAISTSGVVLAWNSMTPWLGFAGMILTLYGGFIALGSQWDSDSEADIASRFAWERASGFLLAFFGACVLATTRPALLISPAENWLTQTGHIYSTWVGSILLVVGLFVQMQSFPLLGWIVSDSKLYSPVRTLLNQIFPAWASFALLLRLEPQFSSLGIFPIFGWVALFSCTLTVLTGFFQNSWRQGLGVWLAAGLSLSCAFLAFSGPLTAIGLLFGSSLGALALSGAGAALEGQCAQTFANKKKAIWFKGASLIAAAAGTGGIGFISATGGLRWIAQVMPLPGEIALFLFVFFLFVLLGWRMGWKVSQIQNATEASWLSVLSVFLWIFFTVGLLWTGTVTGEILIGNPDRLFRSFFEDLFGRHSEFTQLEDFITASGLYWGVTLVAFLTAFWTSGRKEDQWEKLAALIPRTSNFLKLGYRVDSVSHRVTCGVIFLGQIAEKWVDQKIWKQWVPMGVTVGISRISKILAQVDAGISSNLVSSLRKFVEVPAKLLQMIQTGDIRWYLLFALGSGFALLSHFLRT